MQSHQPRLLLITVQSHLEVIVGQESLSSLLFHISAWNGLGRNADHEGAIPIADRFFLQYRSRNGFITPIAFPLSKITTNS